MILQALTRYYEILQKDPEIDIAPPGYSTANVSFALNLSTDGELLDIFPLFEKVQRGKSVMEKPQRRIVPEQVKRTSGIAPNFLCDSSTYVLGISDKEAAAPDYTVKRFEAFREYNRGLLEPVNCPTARAILGFFDRYGENDLQKHPKIIPILDDLKKPGNMVFMVQGTYVIEDPDIQASWRASKLTSDAPEGQCLVSGENAPIARLHASIKGVRDTNSSGATLVGFNAAAYESYNRAKGQGLNAPVSEKAAFAYTTVLNYLLSPANPNRKIYLGDTTVVYWAESEDPGYTATFGGLIDPDTLEATPQMERRKAEVALKDVAKKVSRAQAIDVSEVMKDLNPDTPFYILGLAPNAARISVRFFITEPFQKVIARIMAHYEDMQIIKEFENQPNRVSIGAILRETVSQKASDPKAAPLLAGAVMRAILTGLPYPAALYNAIITRIRADQDDNKRFVSKIGYVRAAVIKAFLLRKFRYQQNHPMQEIFQMSLSEQSTYAPYVLGRLFAVLEKVQAEAIGTINASIKDRYFTTACASPASVFPVLLRLSQHHIAKAEYGKNADRRIQDILNLLDVETNPIPPRLSLDEQGAFVLGYYHQRAAFFTPRSDSATQNSDEEIN